MVCVFPVEAYIHQRLITIWPYGSQ